MSRHDQSLQKWTQVRPIVIYFEDKIVVDNYHLRQEGLMPVFVYQAHCFLGHTVVTPIGEYMKDVVT